MKEYKYRISMKDRETGEHLHIYVWARDCDEATHIRKTAMTCQSCACMRSSPTAKSRRQS